ncbi:MAG: arsenite methyltransferase, partial [Deltaproteobacteria bacterium]|nr:arsenite methyltransferase [Deltaproteobacteria bacterium]
GCGVPTEYAKIKPGDTVVDLGSGAGNDAFVARAIVGEKGKVIGIDMTPLMIEKARQNAEKLGHKNVEFKLGDIEAMPLEDGIADVVVSNCVLNLVPDKKKAFAEIFRILKPGAHFSISDVVLGKPLPEGLQKAAEMYAGCVAGASLKDDYLAIIGNQGFVNVHVQTEKAITIPDDVLAKYLDEKGISDLKSSGSVILSVTVYGEKPHAG